MVTAATELDPEGRPIPEDGPRRRPLRRRSIVWFAVGLVASFVFLELAARELGPSATARVVIEQHRDQLADVEDVPVLFVGDSSLGADVDPMLFTGSTGIDAYSVWLPDASAEIVEQLLTDFTFSATSADTVVIGVTARMFNEATRPDRERLLAQVSTSLPWQDRTDPSLFTTLERWGSRLAIVRYRAGLRRPSDWVVSYRSEAELVVQDGGQVEFFLDKDLREIRGDYESSERNALRDFASSDAELSALTELVDELDRQGMQVYVALLPTHGEVYDRFFPNGAADRTDFRARLRTELSGGPAELIDLSSFDDRPELFADGNHMNGRGAELVTAELAERISP